MSIRKSPSEKRAIVFKGPKGAGWEPVQLPCGQCVGCRLERSRQWAMRCVHESELYEENCFLTLTFSDENLPKDGSVRVRDLQLFFKKLRKKISSEKFIEEFPGCGSKIRFFACGEYGEGLARPHYHAIIFGFDFPDRVFSKMLGEYRVYESEILSSVWGNGLAWIGTVTFDSAAYVAGYVLKKRTGKGAVDHYVDQDGVVLTPEFLVMSRGGRGKGHGGIGSEWFEKFGKEVYGSTEDFVVIRGVKVRPPKFYDRRLEMADAGAYQAVMDRRRLRADDPKVVANNTRARLLVREVVAKSKQSLTLRRYERDS